MSKTRSTVIKKERFRATRPLDYIYDPLFVVSGEKDYNRMIMKEIVSNSQYSIRPIYESMFSDMLRYPRAALVLRTSEQLPANFDITYKGRLRSLAGHPAPMTDVDGADRFKFYRRPVTFQSPEAGNLRYPLVALDNITKYAMFSTPADVCFDQEISKLRKVEESVKPATLTKCIQTDYRETETQTTPWAPPYSVAGRKTPEVLSLACLSWGHGLPAGMHEIEIIERLRIKRAWEKEMDTTENMEKRRKIIAEIENNDWAFREQEIQAIHDLRIALAKQLLDQHRNECKEKLNDRVKRVAERKNKEKDEKLKSIQLKKERALRKLTMKHKGCAPTFRKLNVTEEHLDRTSQIFAPIKRFGTEFRNRHEVLHSANEFLKSYKDLTMLENFQTRVPIFDYEKASKPKMKEGELCSRETRWTEETLAKLHKDLQEMTAETKKSKSHATLPLKIVQKPSKPKEIVLIEQEISDEDDKIYNASVLLQKVIHGRATQLQMFNEYKKLKPLVEELATTHTLKSDYQSKINENLEHIMNTRQLELLERRSEAAVNSVLGDTQGKTIGMVLDFLAKELMHLKTERNAHALALLAERARYGREAAESGRRQKELQRLKEHDEMFKQVVKIHQETVDMYLEDIVMQAMDMEASGEARAHVQQLARNIDLAAHEAQIRSPELEKEELVADLVFNFALPEANKQIVRNKMKQRQQKYLRLAHDIIYNRKGEEIDEGAVKLTKHMVSEISRFSFREHVPQLHWEKIEKGDIETERISELVLSKEVQLKFDVVKDVKLWVDTLIEEGIKKIRTSFEEELESTSEEITKSSGHTVEASESKEIEVLLYPYEIKNLVKEILMQTVMKATDIAEWKKEVWSITSDISCLECLQIGSFEGVEFQGKPYKETSVESTQHTAGNDSITRLLPMLEVAYCVAPAKTASASSSVRGSQEVFSEDITTLCVDAEDTLPALDSESDKQSSTVSNDEATIFMGDSEFEERELRSTTSDPSCFECLHITINKQEEMMSQSLSVQSQADGIKETSNVQVEVICSHEIASTENPDTDDD